MGGDEIVMRRGSLMMIHGSSGLTVGNADDHEKQIEMLHKLDGQMAKIYAASSGEPVAGDQADDERGDLVRRQRGGRQGLRDTDRGQ
jgi:ATP-dependent protease ClpP protease subunit